MVFSTYLGICGGVRDEEAGGGGGLRIQKCIRLVVMFGSRVLPH